MKIKACLIILMLICGTLYAQYAPGYDKPGTDAVYKDSSVIKAWATDCEVKRGYINITDTSATYTQNNITSNYATFGSDSLATGIAAGDCVSLGDGGTAVLRFRYPVTNGTGPDFVVFENGFDANVYPFYYFLELAYVEVSSDGYNFVRFPAVSLTQDSVQLGTYDQINPEKIHNLAGKHVLFYGTPFDLEDLKDSAGIDIDSITHIKIIDIAGCIENGYANYDSQGNIINDPFPTPFNTAGFDLDAVGVINQKKTNIDDTYADNNIKVFPNPARNIVNIKGQNIKSVNIYDIKGNNMYHSCTDTKDYQIDINSFGKGIYFIKILNDKNIVIKKLIVY